jgi:hypothetical protein
LIILGLIITPKDDKPPFLLNCCKTDRQRLLNRFRNEAEPRDFGIINPSKNLSHSLDIKRIPFFEIFFGEQVI